MEIDHYSKKILEALQTDARQSVAQLAQQVGLSVTPCWRRIKAMEEAGVIERYRVDVNRQAVGLSLMVLAEVNLSEHSEKTVNAFERAVQAEAGIVRCLATTGTSDYMLTILARNIEEYERHHLRALFRLPGVAHVRSSIVLREIKQAKTVPLTS